MLHPECCARLVSVVWHCRLCKYDNPEFSFVVPRWWNELPSTTRAGASLSTFKKLLTTPLFREHFPCVTCNYSSYISALLFSFYFILLYFLCKVVFIVTPGSIAR